MTPRALVTGLALGESPRWHGDRLWFADWGALEIAAVDREGRCERVAHLASFPFCIDWLPDGRMVVVAGRDRRLLRREADGTLVTHADLSGVAAYPWNDIAVDPRGNVFVDNIGFDFPGGEFRTGAIAVVTPDGDVRQVANGLSFPNGMAITPDGQPLIVAESYGKRLTAFDIAADGGLANRRVWAELAGGAPDGICLDADGCVWYADVPAKRCVRVREGGVVLQVVEFDRGCFACALGGRTLYMMTAEWPACMKAGSRTGQVVTIEAPAPAA